MIARPAFDSGSYRAPAKTLPVIETVGKEGFSTSRTFKPLSNRWLCTARARRRPISLGFTIVLPMTFGPIAQ